jgi:hypothetical protein
VWSYDMSYGYNPDYNRNNYVSTDPGYDPYSQPTQSQSSGMGTNMWGALLSGVGQYAGARADANMQRDMSQLSAEARKELLLQQREYDKDDQEYRQESVSKWGRYFGG